MGDVGRVKGLRAGKLDEAGDGSEGERVLEAPAGKSSLSSFLTAGGTGSRRTCSWCVNTVEKYKSADR